MENSISDLKKIKKQTRRGTNNKEKKLWTVVVVCRKLIIRGDDRRVKLENVKLINHNKMLII